MPGQWRWRSHGHNSLDWVGRWPSGMTVVMVTAGHLACGPVTAMRSLSSALGNRHDQEGAARHRLVGGGRRDGHDRRHPGGRQRGHAHGDQAPARAHDQAGTGCCRGGHRVRPGRPGGVRQAADRWIGPVPVAGGTGGSPARSLPPRARGGLPRAWPVTGARQGPGPGRRPATRDSAARCRTGRCSATRCSAGWCSAGWFSVDWCSAGRRPRRARRRGALRAAARAEPHECVLTRRAHRHARRWPRARNAGRRGHPGDPAHRGSWAGSRRAGSRGTRRRARPGPAALWPGRTSAAAPRLSAGNESGRPRPGAPWPGWPARAPHATPRSRALP